MSRVYDSWERLVGATLKREHLRELALCPSISSSTSSDFIQDVYEATTESFSPSRGLCAEATTESFSKSRYTVVPMSKQGIKRKIFSFLLFKKRRLIKTREKFFRQNGGLLLRHIPSITGGVKPGMIFSAEELDKATNNFSADNILHSGGRGPAYKGILADQKIVAIVRSRIMDPYQIEQFLEEVFMFARVNHRNLVKLLGCCLENETPLLVYEFISNGTLSHHIQNNREAPWFSWSDRLRIAAESASALAYLHSAAFTPRNVKSSNILLDENYSAKISYSVSPRLFSINLIQETTAVRGTIGYLDPEFLHTEQFTNKSDVYSFGVVLAELMTGRKPFSYTETFDERCLSSFFLLSLKSNSLLQILDPRVRREGSIEQLIAAAELIQRCLSLHGEDRPMMRQVAMELEFLRKLSDHPWIQPEVREEFVGLMNEEEATDLYNVTISPEPSTGPYTMQHTWSSRSPLEELISAIESGVESSKIFSEEELEKASDGYSEDRIIGRGGYAVIYKGILPDQRVVAIKKSRIKDQYQIEQLRNEVIILAPLNHPNVVKLLGCCSESEVPLLVYEFVSNGTLFHHLHHSREALWFSWSSRLRIAAESAGALSYLHSSSAMPIIHGDVKSSNILLDEYFSAKISDFGCSRVVPIDQTQEMSGLIQGTFGYLDPEYFQTGQLTEKSDVYSFGVVLAELMTGRKAFSNTEIEDERKLSTFFLLSLKSNSLFQILDTRVRREGSLEQLQAVAELIKRCLKMCSKDRPTMREVAMELEVLMKFSNHLLVQPEVEKAATDLYNVTISPEPSTEPYTM